VWRWMLPENNSVPSDKVVCRALERGVVVCDRSRKEALATLAANLRSRSIIRRQAKNEAVRYFARFASHQLQNSSSKSMERSNF